MCILCACYICVWLCKESATNWLVSRLVSARCAWESLPGRRWARYRKLVIPAPSEFVSAQKANCMDGCIAATPGPWYSAAPASHIYNDDTSATQHSLTLIAITLCGVNWVHLPKQIDFCAAAAVMCVRSSANEVL